MANDKLVYGSLRDVAQRSGKPVAETFLSVDALVMVDTSGSMDSADCENNRTRYDLACEQLIRLQREIPGKVGVISWSSSVQFNAGGVPHYFGGGTDLAGVLQFVKPADGTTIKLILISDGEPDDEDKALNLARKFKSKIQTIYIGPEAGRGRDFLKRLAEATGGQSVSQSVKDIANLKQTVTKLLTA
jgi:Mg-chelatase subunit ChlD